ncbi:hypothetical protein PHISCL_10411 [Aspergillus sclerotialis]|uniref:Uncharacterized protein n=1 Tax=Aspergillus sclerotialis TaxID=2070753 RepID=A0A3A2Z2G2_9EURO|nr:hypothetical protein PHISCL_10411 [Aspergillus sclerotialis]
MRAQPSEESASGSRRSCLTPFTTLKGSWRSIRTKDMQPVLRPLTLKATDFAGPTWTAGNATCASLATFDEKSGQPCLAFLAASVTRPARTAAGAPAGALY